MNQPVTECDHEAPIPKRQFLWYVSFWHVIYLGTLAIMALQVISEWWWGEMSGWRPPVLLLLLAAQTWLYVRLIIKNPHWQEQWPLPARDLWGYFGGSLLIWFVEWRIEPGFFWMVMSYFGQMFGILPPIAAIPGTTLIYLLTQAEVRDWQMPDLTSGAVFGSLMGWASFMVIYLFIWYLARTSVERGNLIGQLQTAQQELARSREKDVELAALRERERLARDLHDSLGHALVAMSVQLEAIQRLYRVDAERGSAHVDELKTLVRRSMAELRRSLDGLRAPGLGDQSLVEAVQAICVETGQRAGLTISCHLPPAANNLRPALAEVFWRVTQESLTNIEKHAQARQVTLTLLLEPTAAILTVIDDGVGMALERESQPGHYGLRGLRERVEGLGGRLNVSSNSVGTVVEASLPLI